MRSEVERQTYFSDEQTERRTNNDSKETKQSQHRCTQNSKIGWKTPKGEGRQKQ